jgi:hypothetical protein
MSNAVRPKQAIVVIARDDANLKALAGGIRLLPGVDSVRVGTFHKEMAGETAVEIFVPKAQEENAQRSTSNIQRPIVAGRPSRAGLPAPRIHTDAVGTDGGKATVSTVHGS